MITESIVLSRIFGSSELKAALTDFFESQATIETVAAAEALACDIPNQDLARKHACYAKAYGEAMNRLREYVRQV